MILNYSKDKNMERITKKQVDSKVEFLNEEYDLNLGIQRSGYGTKIVSNNGSHDISCNGTNTEIYWHLRTVEEVLRIKEIKKGNN